MSERQSLTAAGVEALAGRLPCELKPAVDLWPGIAAAIRAPREHAGGELSAETPGAEAREEPAGPALPVATAVTPARDLWPEIRARIEAENRSGQGSESRGPRWLAAAASLAAVALIASFGAFVATETSAPPQRLVAAAAGDTWWIALIEQSQISGADAAGTRYLRDLLESVRGEYIAVHDERVAIEAALGRDPSSPMLAALWRHAYEQELALASTAQEITNSFERG